MSPLLNRRSGIRRCGYLPKATFAVRPCSSTWPRLVLLFALGAVDALCSLSGGTGGNPGLSDSSVNRRAAVQTAPSPHPQGNHSPRDHEREHRLILDSQISQPPFFSYRPPQLRHVTDEPPPMNASRSMSGSAEGVRDFDQRSGCTWLDNRIVRDGRAATAIPIYVRTAGLTEGDGHMHRRPKTYGALMPP